MHRCSHIQMNRLCLATFLSGSVVLVGAMKMCPEPLNHRVQSPLKFEIHCHVCSQAVPPRAASAEDQAWWRY